MKSIRKSLLTKIIAMTVIPLFCVTAIGMTIAVAVINRQAQLAAKNTLVGAIGEFKDYFLLEEKKALDLAESTSNNRDIVFNITSLTELETSDPVNLAKGVHVKLAKDLSSIFSGRGYDCIGLYYKGVLKVFLTQDNIYIADKNGTFETPASPSAFVLYSKETWKPAGIRPPIAGTTTPGQRPFSRISYSAGTLVIEARAPIHVKHYDQDTFASQDIIAAEIVVYKGISSPEVPVEHFDSSHTFQILNLDGASADPETQFLNATALNAMKTGPQFIEADYFGKKHYACFGLFRHRGAETAIIGVFQSKQPVIRRTQEVIMWQLMAFVVVLAVALFVVFLVTARIIQPILNVSSFLATIDLQTPSQGELPVPAFHKHDELGALIRSINSFLANLEENLKARRDAEDELRALNEDLENRVTERTDALKTANEALQQAIKKAERATEAKSVFLANVSHELRTPLNGVLGYAQLLEDDVLLSEEQKQQVEAINRSGQHLLGLINEVLEISKIEAGKLQLNESLVDVYKVLDDIKEMFVVPARDHELSFEVIRKPGLPQFLMTDERKFQQILINLLGNAVKHTPAGSVRLVVSARVHDNTAELVAKVIDTGIGIAVEHQEKVFMPFFQSGDNEGRHAGTGLGLSISLGYATLLGGTISLKSSLGNGSTFTLTFPAKIGGPPDEQESKPFQAITGLATDGEPPKILIADDNRIGRELMTVVLTRAGFQVRVAENGKKAIEVFEEWHPDLIIMDMRMPVMDGLTATRKIKEMKAGEDISIVAYSANAFEEERDEMLKAGCDDILGKPLVINDLFKSLKRLLDVEFTYEESTNS